MLPTNRSTLLAFGLLYLLNACGGSSGGDDDDDAAALPTDCRDALAKKPRMADGTVSIDPDGDGPAREITVYCDQTTDGGGWILTYKVRSNIDQNDNPWWDQVLPGSGAKFPTDPVQPPNSTQGPSVAVRADLTTTIGATEWRATTVENGSVVFDMISSYAGVPGQGLRCLASGACGMGIGNIPAPSIAQSCSAAITDGEVLTNTIGGSVAAGGTGFLCDVGVSGCNFCVDWSEVRTNGNPGALPTGVQYVGDSFISRPDATTLYWIR